MNIDNIDVLRPKLNGISPTNYIKLINRRVKRDFKAEIIKKLHKLKKNIAIFTAGRSDFGILKPLIIQFSKTKK